MDRMAEVVLDSKSRNLQQFLTHSKWNACDVIDHVARDANELLGDDDLTGLIIDETSFKKQGHKSVGVSRQWLGRYGKVDNGQVAVFGALAKGRFVTPIDTRLYLPQKWTDAPDRCADAGIPEDCRVFRTKIELALKIVAHARKNGLRFGWVGADAGYGNGPGFCHVLQQMGERFVVDVHCDYHVYLENPQPYITERRSRTGRKPTRYRTDVTSCAVSDIVAAADLAAQPIIRLRKTSRGSLAVRAVQVPVFVWDDSSDSVDGWTLIATQTLGANPETKISLCNFSAGTDFTDLAWRQRQRYWVERTFQDAKSECGMADYQVRKWSAWHHHMALVMMAMLFMLHERIRHKELYPLLTCADIEDLLAHFLPRRDVNKNEVINQLEHRHRMRSAAAESHSRNTERYISLIKGVRY